MKTIRSASTGIFFAQHKYFDQFLKTVKSDSTNLKLFFNGFLLKTIPPLISISYAKEAKEGVLRISIDNFSLTCQKTCGRTVPGSR